ncbi:tetratricopeptide repeat protein [Confluentibacter sediminis]|uniref:tetratricopeptide repeat protein n=1 Tax=Confluentibacter sediminis TaxID=2219045 RepID=UPI001F209E61|nr:tetratricopeptide repeat protein [Confluentibacter sediminis]
MFFKTEAQTSVLNLADNLYASGNYSKAIEQYKLYNMPKEVYNKIAKCYVAIGNYDEALKNYEAYIDANPNDVLIKFEYAILLSQTKKYKEASVVFKDLVAADTKNPNYHYQLGIVLEKLNDSSAIDSYRSTFELDSTHQKSIYKIAKYYLQKGKNQLAEDYADIGLKTYENNLELISLKAQNYYLKQNYKYAAIWFEKLVELGESSHFVHVQLSSCYYKLYEFEKAIEQRKLALEINPDDAESMFLIGKYYYENNDFINAENYMKQALELLDNPLDEEYSKLAVVLNSQKKHDEAIAVLKKAIKENPENINAEFMLVLTKDRYYADIDSKIQAYEDFKKRFPSDDSYSPYIANRISELKNEKFIKAGEEKD